MPEFCDSFTAREVCEGMVTEITVELSTKRAAAKNKIDFRLADRNLSSKSLASYFQSKKRKT